MTIEASNALIEHRKKRGYSQEKLAELIGVSRQTISKWERGEASPDTDNLIALSSLYGITIDEMLFPTNKTETKIADNVLTLEDDMPTVTPVSVEDETIGTTDTQDNTFANDIWEDNLSSNIDWKKLNKFPFPVLCVIFFLVLGALFNLWHPTWMIFLTIPLYYGFIQAKEKGNYNLFPYPVLAVIVFLIAGFALHLWHPAWLIFLTIPLYYWVINVNN